MPSPPGAPSGAPLGASSGAPSSKSSSSPPQDPPANGCHEEGGPPNGSAGGSSPSLSTSDGSRRDCSPPGAPSSSLNNSSLSKESPKVPSKGLQERKGRAAATAGGPRGGGPQGGSSMDDSVIPINSRGYRGGASLSHRGPRGGHRGAPRGGPSQAPGFHYAAADREVYVHLTDDDSDVSSTEEGGGRIRYVGYVRSNEGPYRGPSIGGPYGGPHGGPQEAPQQRGSLWGPRSMVCRRRIERAINCMHAYINLIIRRTSLGLRFLLFSLRKNERQLKIILYTAGLLISSTGNTISFKRMLDKMPNYSGFLNQLTNFVFIPIFAALCLYQYFVGKLSQEVLSFPKKNFALMGSLDGVCGIMAVVGGVHTSGTAQVVLSQLGIPVMLLLCRFMLGKRYNIIQHIGAAVIIFGVLVVESPGLLHPTKEDNSNSPFFNLLFLLSILPSSLSYVVKEVAFRGFAMNTSFLQFWVALFQFFVGFALLPLTSLPLLGKEVVPLGDLWRRLINGGKCFLGKDTIVPPVCGPTLGVACDSCQGAWVEVAVYILFNLIYNVCSMLVLKHCGATVLFLIMTVRLPLTSMAFYSRLIVGDSAVPAKATDFFGLLILLVGLLAFRLGGHQATRGGAGEEQEEGEGSLDQDITATAEVAHVHIKVLASDPSIRNDGYFHCFSDEEAPSPHGRRRQRQPGVYTPPNPSSSFEEPQVGFGAPFVPDGGAPRRR